MTPSQTIEFIKDIGCTEIYVVLPVKLEKAETELQKIKELGYAAFLRTTGLGEEIVVIDKVWENATIGSARTDA